MLRVVLADDENKVILLMQKLIDWEALGYEIAGTANDGLRALELVREKQPHLLITDVRMPGCDGIELIQRAKALQPKLHFIVISGYRKFEYAQNALKYGVEDYLLKPLKQEELTGILLRLKEKMGQEAALEFQLKRSGEHQQELLLDALLGTAERGTSFLSAGQANGEYGFHFGSGTYAAAVIRVDVPDAESYQDGYRILLRHALEIVRRERSFSLGKEFGGVRGLAGPCRDRSVAVPAGLSCGGSDAVLHQNPQGDRKSAGLVLECPGHRLPGQPEGLSGAGGGIHAGGALAVQGSAVPAAVLAGCRAGDAGSGPAVSDGRVPEKELSGGGRVPG